MLIYLFIANAIAHVISFVKLYRIESPQAIGVLIFGFINIMISYLLWQQFSWAMWLALIFPLVGGTGLLLSTILKTKGTWIDYLILVLDLCIITIVLATFL